MDAHRAEHRRIERSKASRQAADDYLAQPVRSPRRAARARVQKRCFAWSQRESEPKTRHERDSQAGRRTRSRNHETTASSVANRFAVCYLDLRFNFKPFATPFGFANRGRSHPRDLGGCDS
jgi:hypothetical protein